MRGLQSYQYADLRTVYAPVTTISGDKVWEPQRNWGRDYWALEDALNYGCILLTAEAQEIAVKNFAATGFTIPQLEAALLESEREEYCDYWPEEAEEEYDPILEFVSAWVDSAKN